MAKAKRLPEKYQVWVDARKRFNLSHAQTLMARELGLNPKKLGKLVPHDGQDWKLPLPQYIEHLYSKNFSKTRPDNVMPIEKLYRAKKERKAKRKADKIGPSGDHQPKTG